jgi:hypothetical protein
MRISSKLNFDCCCYAISTVLLPNSDGKLVTQSTGFTKKGKGSRKAQVCVVSSFQRICSSQIKEQREDIVNGSDEEVGYEDDDNKSAVNEKNPI